MRANRSLRILAASAVLLAGLAGCGSSERSSPNGSPTPAAPRTSTGPTATGSGAGELATPSLPVWPTAPRTVNGGGPGPAVLTAIRTGQHGSYERVVLEFRAAYGTATVRYVPVVRADPSDQPIVLGGHAFLEVTVHAAVARWGDPAQPYAGPSTLKPQYRTVKQVTITGDFEAVLSLGIGLDRVTGFQVFRLSSPDRLVIDLGEPSAGPGGR